MINYTKRRGYFALLFCAVFFISLLAMGQNLAQYEKKIHAYTLDNGLRVIILEDHSAPVASFATYADVGSANEVVGTTGLAHILEHMAFKGTSKFGTFDYAKEKLLLDKLDAIYAEISIEKKKFNPDKTKIEKLEKEFNEVQEEHSKIVDQAGFMRILEAEGGEGLNAGTSADSTVYTINLPSNKAELWAMMESLRFKDTVFREYYKERNVVIEERRLRTDSNPIGRLFEEFLALAYKAHPYGIGVIGHMSDLQQMTIQDLKAFFNKYYVASNLTLAIAGDVNPDKMIEQIRKYWSDMPKFPKPEAPKTVEPEQLGEKKIVIMEKSQPILLMGYHKPAQKDKDEPLIGLLSNILANGRTSRLNERLVKKDKSAIATFAFPGLPGSKYPGLILVGAVPSQGKKSADVDSVILEEIEKLKNEKVSIEELNKVKIQAKAQLIRSMDSNLGMAMALAQYEVNTGDWRNLFRELDALAAITPDDIQNAAKKYLTAKNRTVAMIETEESK
jgi:predicted Zn-dependent peptidase